MANDRDPRVDPRAGDVLAGVNDLRIRVTQVNDGIVTFAFDALSELGDDHRPIKAWRAWAKTATIVKKAEDA